MKDGQSERSCTKCGKRKKLNEFYTKGKRVDSWCKECRKKARTARYHKDSKEFKQFQNNRISEVIMTRVKKVNKEKASIIESMLEKMIVTALGEK